LRKDEAVFRKKGYAEIIMTCRVFTVLTINWLGKNIFIFPTFGL